MLARKRRRRGDRFAGALVASTANIAMLAQATALQGAGSATAIARGVVRSLRASRIKLAAAACTCVLLLLAVTSLVARSRDISTPLISHPMRSVPGQPGDAWVAAGVKPDPASQPEFSINVGDGSTVRILGISTFPPDADSWFAANGAAIPAPDDRLIDRADTLPNAVPPQFMVAVRIDHPSSDSVRLHVQGSDAGSNIVINDADAMIILCPFSYSQPPTGASMELGITDSKWRTLAKNDQPAKHCALMRPNWAM